MTLSEFRAAFPELETAPDGTVSYWLGVAKNFVNPDRWGEQEPLGIGLFVAHWLACSQQQASSAASGSAGGGGGVMTSKSVGPVSASYDVSSVMSAGAGQWNQTTYGRQYWMLAQMFGNGAAQF